MKKDLVTLMFVLLKAHWSLGNWLVMFISCLKSATQTEKVSGLGKCLLHCLFRQEHAAVVLLHIDIFVCSPLCEVHWACIHMGKCALQILLLHLKYNQMLSGEKKPSTNLFRKFIKCAENLLFVFSQVFRPNKMNMFEVC